MIKYETPLDELKVKHFDDYQKLAPIHEIVTTDQIFGELYIEQDTEQNVTHMLLQDDEAATVVQVSLDNERKNIWIKINALERTFEFTESQTMHNCMRFFMEGMIC